MFSLAQKYEVLVHTCEADRASISYTYVCFRRVSGPSNYEVRLGRSQSVDSAFLTRFTEVRLS